MKTAKWLKVLTAGLMAMALTACGGGGNDKDDDDPNTTPALTQIKVTPEALELEVDQTAMLQVTGKDENNQDAPLTDAITWTSNNENVATVANGQVTAKGAGDTTVTVSYGDLPSVDVAVKVKAKPPVITELKVTPAGPLSLEPGNKAPFAVVDQAGMAVADAQWVSDDTEIANFSGSELTAGSKEGSTQVYAKRGDLVSNKVTVEVKKPPVVLQSLALSADKKELMVAETANLVLEGTYSDGSKAAVTDAQWSVAPVDVASVAAGVLKAQKAGSALVKATKGGVSSNEVTVTVNNPPVVLTKIEINSADSGDLVVKATRQFSVTATYSDGTSKVIPGADVTWKPADEKVISVKEGLATALALGKVILNVEYGGIAAAIEINVVAPRVTVYFKKPEGWKSPIKMHWWLEDKDGKPVKDVGTTWPGEDMKLQPTVAVVGAEQWYEATVVGHEAINVVFNDGGSSDKGFHQTTDQKGRKGGYFVPNKDADKTSGKYDGKWYDAKPVEEVTLVSIELTSTDSGDLGVGATRQFIAKGTYSDKSVKDLADAKWSVDPADEKVMKVSEKGLVTALGVGKAKLIAAAQDKTASLELSVVEFGLTVYFHKPTAWKNPVKVYWWVEQTDGHGRSLPVVSNKWPGDDMEADADGWFKKRISGQSRVNVIFNDGGSVTMGFKQTVDLLDRAKDGWFVPNADVDKVTGKFAGTWHDTKPTVNKPEPKLAANPAGGEFTGDSVEVTLNAEGDNVAAKYALDAADVLTAGVAFKSGDKVKLGEALKAGETVKLKLYGQDAGGKVVTLDYTFTKAAQIADKFKPASTNPTFGKKVTDDAIVIDGKNSSEWNDDMLIALDAANDDPRSLGDNWTMHETPLDVTHLWAAWDSKNLYLAWQYANVTDSVDAANAGSTKSTLDLGIPMWIAFDTVAGKGAKLDVWGKNSGKPYWGGADLPEYQLYVLSDLRKISEMGGKGIISVVKDGTDGFYPPDAATGYVFFNAAGIEVAAANGLAPAKLWGYKDADDAGKADKLVDFVTLKHAANKDAFYEIKIPLAALGNPDLEKTGLGVMLGHGDGSAMDSIPNDKATSDTAGVTSSNSSKEWSDVDLFTAPFARVGK